MPATPREQHPFAHLEDPYPWYQAIRQPPFCNQAYGAWLVTRYEDIRWVLDQPDLFSSRETMSPPQSPPASVQAVLAEGSPPVPAILNSDGAPHRRLRALVEAAFQPQLKAMRARLRTQANDLVDAFVEAEQADLISQFALPLAFGAFSVLLDIPGDAQSTVRHLCDDTVELAAAMLSPTPLPEERQVACARSLVQLQRFWGGMVHERRVLPGTDFISVLTHTSLPDAPALAEDEVVAVLMDLVLGGYHTTAALFGHSVLLLLQTPGAWQRLQAHPQHLRLVVEEALRYEAPVQAMVRTTTRAVLLPGGEAPVPPDTQLLLFFGAANRDPAVFAHAEEVLMQRHPSPHLAFGAGVHSCLGAPLARLEGRVALEVLMQRLPRLRLTPAQPLVHVPTLLFRALHSLEVTWK